MVPLKGCLLLESFLQLDGVFESSSSSSSSSTGICDMSKLTNVVETMENGMDVCRRSDLFSELYDIPEVPMKFGIHHSHSTDLLVENPSFEFNFGYAPYHDLVYLRGEDIQLQDNRLCPCQPDLKFVEGFFNHFVRFSKDYQSICVRDHAEGYDHKISKNKFYLKIDNSQSTNNSGVVDEYDI